MISLSFIFVIIASIGFILRAWNSAIDADKNRGESA
jgi:hypothetical protein